MAIFTDSALWAGSVMELPCPFVCKGVIKVVIVYYGKIVRFFVFAHKIKWLNMVLIIINLEGHQSCMIGSEVTTILTTCFVNE